MLRFVRYCSHQQSFATLAFAFLLAATGSTVFSARHLQAADQLAYSFESDTNGFVPNAGGITVTQDTVGATDGTKALRIAVVGGQTFAGALTANIDPLILGDPPGVDHVTLDLTINAPFPTPPATEGFAVLGVTIFGASQPGPGQLTGLSVQFFDLIDPAFNNERHLDGMTPGLYKDFRIDLTHATHPTTFDERQSFNEIFGTIGSGANDIIPSGFQFYINKSGGGSFPINISIDNVRFGVSVAGDYNGNGIVDAADYTVWRDNLGLMGGATVAQGDGTGDGNVTAEDYAFWKQHFGDGAGSGSGGLVASVPEPTGFFLMFAVAVCVGVSPRSTRQRFTSACRLIF